MKWNVRALFAGEQERLPIRDELDLSAWEFQGNCPLQKPVTVDGEAAVIGGVVRFRAEVRYRFEGVCDRCLAAVKRDESMTTEHILVTSAEEEDSDAFVVLEDHTLDLDELIADDLLLEMPSKTLCREDCRGLCPRCGKNLNEGKCGCAHKTVDPRLAALSHWLK